MTDALDTEVPTPDRETIIAVVGAKPFWQSKTNIHGAITLLIALATFLSVHPLLDAWSEWILLVNGVLIIVTRWLTNQPVTLRGSQPDA
jgi:hypothetical protein